MSVKVKCQHCWKVFEVPEEAINKKRKCTYCQRMTLAKPLEIKDNIIDNEEKEKKDISLFFSSNTVFLLNIIILLLCILNFIFLFIVKRGEEGIKETTLQSISIFEENINNSFNELNKLLSEINNDTQKLKKLNEKVLSPKKVAKKLIKDLEPSFSLLTEKILNIKSKLRKILKEYKKFKKDINNYTLKKSKKNKKMKKNK